ncbi:MAG: hypothetical protein PHG75_02120 [Syntrophomonas sp.]|nr:hypothetical protein [Syntrophomonas sp.]
MEGKARVEKKLRQELSEVSKEIKARIARLDELSEELEAGYGDLEKTLNVKQAVIDPKLNDPAMSGEAAWEYVWNMIQNSVTEMGTSAKASVQKNQGELLETFQKRKEALRNEIDVTKMSGREVWGAVWNAVWNDIWGSVDQFHHHASTEITSLGDELQELLGKQAELQGKLNDMRRGWNAQYNVVRGFFDNMVKGKS